MGDPGPKPNNPIVLTTEQLRTLKAIVAKAKSEQRAVQRAQTLLLAYEGWSNARIAAHLHVTRQTVVTRRIRFIEEGMEALEDHPRSGRPRIIPPLD